ncbi:hypothetical protein CBER1_02496 [Cercospora berteroae]|uniref:DUF4149 domain-containing protein n=1 Tax=Cercospora berteroae TaxID=357750 RepID=A0A2S6C447_9PEZI|nr:hypothetical protein CBER1_02496 [Cercospora berteroae]
MAFSQPGTRWLLKELAYTSIVFIAVSNLSTSLLFIPSLLRPITTIAPLNQLEESKSTNDPNKTDSLLSVPQTPVESGRLTPQISQRAFDFSQHLGSSGTYKAVARQFSELQTLGTKLYIPLESTAMISLVALSTTTRKWSYSWKCWLGAVGVLVTVDLLKAFFMAPLALKVLRVAGDAEPIEPYEDAPIDREAEKSNTVQFLRKWNVLNLASGLVLLGTSEFVRNPRAWSRR